MTVEVEEGRGTDAIGGTDEKVEERHVTLKVEPADESVTEHETANSKSERQLVENGKRDKSKTSAKKNSGSKGTTSKRNELSDLLDVSWSKV